MSDHEFENYLALLSRLLRLDGKQRESIAGELRAHLEDRLDELLAQGVTRDEAVRKALEEFGDAASLAGQLGAIGRKRKRRWLMRVTTFSVAATVLIAAGMATFWPGRNAGPGIAQVVAQAPGKHDKLLQSKDPVSTKNSEIAAALDKRLDVNVVETPLRKVIDILQKDSGATIHLRGKALADAGVNFDSPVTADFKQIRLSTILDLILDEFDLTYVEKDELILVTSHADAEATLAVRVYDCRDLLDWPAIAVAKTAEAGLPGGEGGAAGGGGGGGGFGAAAPPGGGFGGAMPGMPGGFGGMGIATDHDMRAMRLMSIITTNVEPQSWRISFQNAAGTENAEAAGAVSEYSGLIVITQTAQTHKKIEHVLDMLREAAGIDGSKAAKTKVVR